MAKLLLQVMATFILIQILLDLTSLFKTDGIVPVPAADGPRPNASNFTPADRVRKKTESFRTRVQEIHFVIF